MIEQSYYPSVDELIAEQRTRRNIIVGLLVLTVGIIFTAMALLGHFSPKTGGMGVLGAGFAAFIMLVIPVVIWNQPRVGFYILFGFSLLLEAASIGQEAAVLPTMWVVVL